MYYTMPVFCMSNTQQPVPAELNSASCMAAWIRKSLQVFIIIWKWYDIGTIDMDENTIFIMKQLLMLAFSQSCSSCMFFGLLTDRKDDQLPGSPGSFYVARDLAELNSAVFL